MATLQEPKRPQSAYFLYINATREKTQTELGVKSFGEVTKVQAERWKTMPETEKAQYEKQASSLKVQYDKDLVAFKEAGGVVGQARAEKRSAKKEKADRKAKAMADSDKPKRAGKAPVDANKPKKPAGGAFGVWLNDHRVEIMKSLPAGSKATAAGPVASTRWKAMSEEDKQPYQKRYEEKAAKYKEDMKAWKDTNGCDDDADADESPGKGEPSPEVEKISKAPEKITPKRRSKPESLREEGVVSPPQKKAKGRARGVAVTPTHSSNIDTDVLKKAGGLGLEAALQNLAVRDGMANISAEKMLSALQQSGGLVNKAKAVLLAGA